MTEADLTLSNMLNANFTRAVLTGATLDNATVAFTIAPDGTRVDSVEELEEHSEREE